MIASLCETVVDLTPAERSFLQERIDKVWTVAPGGLIRAQDARVDGVFMLHHGAALSAVELEDGRRQIVKVHVAGDLMGAPSLPFATSVEGLTALTECRIGRLPQGALGELFADHARLGAVLFLLANAERALLMDALVTRGQLCAEARVCALLVQLHDRLGLNAGARDATVALPLTQQQIAEALGLSTVHVNRVLRGLVSAGRIRRDGRVYELLDLPHLRAATMLGERRLVRNPAWLPSPHPAAAQAPGSNIR